MTAPVLVPDTTFTEQVLDHAQAWTDGSDDHATYLSSLAAMFEQVYFLVTPFGDPEDPENYWAPWAVLLDPANCPTAMLPFLSQFNGTNVMPGTPDAVARQQITTESAMNRGTLAAIKQAATNNLVGTQYLHVNERTAADGTENAYHAVLTFKTSECPDEAALVNAVESQKPAGIQITYVSTQGYTWNVARNTWSEETMTWNQATDQQP